MQQIKHIIWDLGDTLVYPKTWCYAQEIGLFDFLMYPLLDHKNPLKLYLLAFELLENIEPLTENDLQGRQPTAREHILPVLMRQWLTGHLDRSTVMQRINDEIQHWDIKKRFVSEREKRLLKNTLHVMFNPSLLATCLRPINTAVSLVQAFAVMHDHNGNPRFTQYILSNWDADSFHAVLEQDFLQPVFQQFNRDHIFISGEAGTMKPDPIFYETFLEKYALNPQECIFIDDLEENILTARELGMTAFHINKQDYREVERLVINGFKNTK